MSKSTIDERYEQLLQVPKTWVVTGAAGFIGSHLIQKLLSIGQRVIALDNFSSGHRHNIEKVRVLVGNSSKNLDLHDGDINDTSLCKRLLKGADIVLHQAALGSVPRSVEDPMRTNTANVDGFLSILVAAREVGVKRFVYASSSSVYGDSAELPKVEDRTGRPLSPYAVSKAVNELYARVFTELHGMELIGLRYFNVFGPRQDPEGAYAAVIPRWIGEMLRGSRCSIFGDGLTSRDFCYVANVVQANVLAATTNNRSAFGTAFNIAVGGRTNLRELYSMIRDSLRAQGVLNVPDEPEFKPFRSGDIAHSHASIDRARTLLGYSPTHTLATGMGETVSAYLADDTSTR